MNEIRVDLRNTTAQERKESQRMAQLVFQLNHTMPMTEEYNNILKEIFGDNLGKGSTITAPISGVCFNKMKVGENVYINANLLVMGRGGVTIDDNVQIAANVQLISNNHDPYDRMILTCKPVHIKKGAWIGAGATILPGVTVGKYAIVGASAVVTKDVPDYGVVVGNPAKLIKTLESSKF